MLDSVSTGAAGSRQLDLYAHRILSGDYAPGFFMKHYVKDLGIAMNEAEKSGLSLEILKQSFFNSQELEAAGYGECGNHVVMRHYERRFCDA